MNYQRANEILQSTEFIEVFYQGAPVWINDLQANGVTANVSLDNTRTANTVPVPLNELVEGNKQH